MCNPFLFCSDNFVYFVLFGRLVINIDPKIAGVNEPSQLNVNIGWTIGEEVLFDRNQQIRSEDCLAETETCLLGISKTKLAVIEKDLLDKRRKRDFNIIESTLKGNFLIKQGIREEAMDQNLETRNSNWVNSNNKNPMNRLNSTV